MFRQMTLRIKEISSSKLLQKLVLYMILIGFIPACILYSIILTVNVQLLFDNVKSHSEDTLNQAENNVLQLLDQADTISMGLSIDDSVINLMEKDDLAVGSLDRSELRTILDSTLRTNRTCLNMLLIETENSVVYSYVTDSGMSPQKLRLFTSDLSSALFQTSGLFWLDMSNTEYNRSDSLRCSRAIQSFRLKKSIGIISLFLKKEAFFQSLSTIPNLYDNQNVLLLDKNHSLLVSSSPIPDEWNSSLPTVDFDNRDSFRLTIGSTAYYGTSKMFHAADSDWYLLSLLPYDYFNAYFTENLKPFLLIIIVIPIAALLFTSFFYMTLYKNMIPFQSTLKEFRANNLSVRTPIQNDTVIDNIGTALNQTLDDYQTLVQLTGHQEALLTVSRLKLLRGQLSPHFLFNTLDIVNWKLIDNNQLETSQIISDLGTLLRYSIDTSSETVALKEELEINRRYLSICKHRFEDKLSYAFTVPSELEEYRIPRFLLQPIVENAVIHGIEKSTVKGTILINCFQDDTNTIIEIINSGPSLSEEERKAINNSIHHPDALSIHIGLSNVNERIKISFGPEYGINVLDGIPQGLIVRLLLPKTQRLT